MGDFINPVGYSWEVSISIHCVHVLCCIAVLHMLVAKYTACLDGRIYHILQFVYSRNLLFFLWFNHVALKLSSKTFSFVQ